MTGAVTGAGSRTGPSSDGSNPSDGTDTGTVRLLNFPLALHAAWREHYDEVMREFSLLVLRPHVTGANRDLPVHLLELAAVLHRYGAGPLQDDPRRDAAAGAGRATADLDYDVPLDAAPVVQSLLRFLQQADEYCRTERLLTLALPPEERRFRDWFLGSFADQLSGAAPEPWSGPAV